MLSWNIAAWLLAAVALAYAISVARDALDKTYLSQPTDRGVVIEGYCPAPVEPMAVRPNLAEERVPVADYAFSASARKSGIQLDWTRPDIDGITSYTIIRYGVDQVNGTANGNVHAISIDDDGVLGEWFDDDGLQRGNHYQYRSFPVTADGIETPSRAVRVWTLPDIEPAAPERVVLTQYATSLRVTSYPVRSEQVNGLRVLRRSSGEESWQLVHEEMEATKSVALQRFGRHWIDDDADATSDYEYAACVANALGFGRAMQSTTEHLLHIEPHDAMGDLDPSISNVAAVASEHAITVYWSPIKHPDILGYVVERLPVDESDIHYLREDSDHWAQNYVDFSRRWILDTPEHRFRVRAKTVNGAGAWSSVLTVDTGSESDLVPDLSTDEIVSATATYRNVHLVWSWDGPWDRVESRVLRREVGNETDFKASEWSSWVDPHAYSWWSDYSREAYSRFS